jgi:hypothetical protein
MGIAFGRSFCLVAGSDVPLCLISRVQSVSALVRLSIKSGHAKSAHDENSPGWPQPPTDKLSVLPPQRVQFSLLTWQLLDYL